MEEVFDAARNERQITAERCLLVGRLPVCVFSNACGGPRMLIQAAWPRAAAGAPPAARCEHAAVRSSLV